MARDLAVLYHCALFLHKLVRAEEEVVEEVQVVLYKVRHTEVFTEVFLLAIQSPADGPRLVAKPFVSECHVLIQ